MVHAHQAVQEAWRVLKPDGLMCDSRPFSSFLPIEVIQGEKRIAAGFVDVATSPLDSVDRSMMAADVLAMSRREGRFELEKQVLFNVQYYWDSLEGIIAHFTEEVVSIPLSEELKARIAELLAEAGPGAQVAVSRTMVMGRYRKLEW